MRKPLFLSENTRHRVGQGIIIFLAIVALIGLGDSVLIHLKEIAGKTDPSVFNSCSVSDVISCSKVANSQYSNIFGLPVSLIGIMFYEGILLLCGALWFGLDTSSNLKLLLSLIISLALFFSLRLLYFSYLGLGAICPYCAVSNLTTSLIALGWFWYLNQKALVFALLCGLAVYCLYVFLIANWLASRF